MALRERAALAVLSGKPHGKSLDQQRAERQRLGGRPVDALARLDRLGAIVTKTITRELRAGNPLPRVVERPGSLINAIGIPSKGVDYFIQHTIKFYAQYNTPLVVSISAPTAEGFASLASELSIPGVAAIEANISCPNIEADGKAFAMRPDSTEIVTRRLREATNLPL